MADKQSVEAYEYERLEQTIALAKEQIIKARAINEDNKTAIISAKKELREGTPHSVANLWSSDGFEALAAISQYMNPITDKIADYEALENKIMVLENMIKAPYFARIDFTFEDEDDAEQIYIGRTSLMNENNQKIYVYDWRAPIASVFYRFVTGEAFYDAPAGRIHGEVSLKRQYEINNGKLDYYFDADVQIIDEFLRKMLSENTSPKMKTIIETIQKEQDVIIRDMENDLMMVQGAAGSGKTSIALHRAAYLMYQGLSAKLSANNILIISPNTLFEQYISNVLPELGESHIVSVIFEELAAAVIPDIGIETKNQFLENLITATRYRNIIKSSIEFKTSLEFIAIIEQFIRDLPRQWIAFEDIYYDDCLILRKEELQAKVLSGIDKIPLSMRLKQIEAYIVEKIREAKKKRLKNWEEVRIIESLQRFTTVNVAALYRTLLEHKDYFLSLAKGVTLPDGIEDILSFTRENLDRRQLSYDDAAVLTYLHLRIHGSNHYKDIKQVVIDEAQDYYPLHFKIFDLIFPHAKFTILGDINQTLEKNENLSLYEQISMIFNKKHASLITLNKSFRCTNEILEYSAKFLDKNLDIKSFNRAGEKPEVFCAPDQLSISQLILAEINTCLEKGYRSIGLICKTERNAINLYHNLKSNLDVRIITNDQTADLQGIFIIPVYMSKGLEFDAVLICDTNAVNYYSEDDKKLLYIACTRALHRLNLFCQGEQSLLL